MLIPLGTDRPAKRRPIVNETFIILNLAVYLYGLIGQYFGQLDVGAIQRWGQFHPGDVKVWQLFTYQFMHDPGSIFHLAFNLVFLWIFGNAVESRLGRIGYLCFYLGGGALAGIAHGLVSPAPVIGASGAVAAVSGGFLALFPRARIKVLFFFIIIGIIQIPALWFIGFYFMIDLVNQVMEWTGRGGRRVAYAAHLGGYLYGFIICFGLLAFGVLKREEFDVFYLFKQMRRRQKFKSTVEKQPAVWDAPQRSRDEKKKSRRPAGALTADQAALAAARAEVTRLLHDHQLSDAAAKYRELLRTWPEIVMPERRQLDIANQFYSEGHHRDAAKAYELLLETYPKCRDAHQVRLILGVIYVRHLGNRERARQTLLEAHPKLTGHERALAEEILKELGVRIPDETTSRSDKS